MKLSYVMNCPKCFVSWIGECEAKCWLCGHRVKRVELPVWFTFKGGIH